VEESDLEMLRDVYASWARGDFSSPSSVFHPDVDFDRTSGDMELDLRGPFH
jgi:ketosteroid isomerase-like protein